MAFLTVCERCWMKCALRTCFDGFLHNTQYIELASLAQYPLLCYNLVQTKRKANPQPPSNGLTSQNGYARLVVVLCPLQTGPLYTSIVQESRDQIVFTMGDGLPLCREYTTGGFSMSTTGTSTTTSTKRRFTPEQLAHRAEYQRRYRREHPEASRRWWRSYVLRKAARLQAEAEAEGGADRGRD